MAKLQYNGSRAMEELAACDPGRLIVKVPLELFRLAVVARELGPEEAVRVYHDGLARAGIKPAIPLSRDRRITESVLKD